MSQAGQTHATLARLRALRLELETLRLHGHREVLGALPSNWMEILRGPEKTREPRDVELPLPSKTVSAKPASREEALENLRAEVVVCAKCPLGNLRTQAVFGVGNPYARLMFVGEAPGADEDRLGEPFVGRAGQLLTDMIGAMGLKRADVYIANVLKCRPPGNRTPAPEEVEHCEPYLLRQIDIIKPEIICALGAVAATTLLKTGTPISRMRGKIHDYHGVPLVPTYHPAYLLRNPAAKKDTWEDLKVVMKQLNLPVPPKKG
ncbi:MAG: uracil-DNA glycosylase [Nitrospinae bacterium]|nr:uracil-DNA glycosylase [Nitrospinota bacterium]